jgi:hypothetical protein
MIFGFEDTRTKPHWVIGQVAHPLSAFPVNQSWAW